MRSDENNLVIKIGYEYGINVFTILFIVIYITALLFGISIAKAYPTYAENTIESILKDVKESPINKLCIETAKLWKSGSLSQALITLTTVGFLRIIIELISALVPPYIAFTYFIDGMFIGTTDSSLTTLTLYLPLIIGDVISISLFESGLLHILISKIIKRPWGDLTWIAIITGIIGIIVVSYITAFSTCIIEGIILSY